MTTSDSASVSDTARWTAAARALESTHARPLFQDPWAEALAGEKGAEWLAQQARSPLGTAPVPGALPMILRTRFFDDFLQAAVQQGGLRQVVILAAGLDTRAYRLEWPEGTQLYEVDQAVVMQHKQQVLDSAGARPACRRSALAADLSQPWGQALVECGFAPSRPAAWLLEGFLFYLPCEAIERVLDQLNALSAPGSQLGFDIVNQMTFTSPITKGWVAMQAQQGAPWLGWLDDPAASLAARGWQAKLTQPGAPDANYGRWALPVPPAEKMDLPHNWYVTAKKPEPCDR